MRTYVLLVLLLALGGLSFSVNVTSCQNISSGGSYVLTADLSGFPQGGFSPYVSYSCLRVSASDVTLDCAGHSITGNGTSQATGVLIVGPVTNVTVKNCVISLYGEGIGAYNGTNSGFITDNTLFNNTYYGLTMISSSYNMISGNDAHSNGNYGFFNYIGAANNTYSNNTAYGNVYDGIRVENSNNNTLTGNILHDNNDGSIVWGTNNSIIDNLIYNHPRSGIELGGCTGCLLVGNIVENSTTGFFITAGTTASLISGNFAFDNDNYGFNIDGATFNVFDQNIVENNNAGMFIRADNNTFTNNTVGNSTYYGMELQGAENNTLADNVVQESGTIDLSAYPYDIPDDCNNFVTGMTGSGGNPIVYFGNSLLSMSGGTYSEIVLCKTDNANLSGITVAGSATLDNNGILVLRSENVSINDTVSSDNFFGLYLELSPGAMVNNLTACGNSFAGLEEYASSGVASTVSDSLLCGNAWEISQDSYNSVPFTLNNVTLGNLTISLSDEVGSGGGGYKLKDTTSPGPAPSGWTSISGKYMKALFTGDLGINSTTVHWTPAEAAGFNEADFRLFTWNGTGWILTPNQTVNVSSHSLTVLNLINITSDDIYGLYAYTPSSGGGGTSGGSNPSLSITLDTSCSNNTVTVRGSGIPQAGASVEADGESIGTTDANGQVTFEGCGHSVTVTASKSGFESATRTGDLVACGLCAPPECTTDSDCASAEMCDSSQMCVPVECPNGTVSDHVCNPYECIQDSDCSSGEVCQSHSCVPQPQPECSTDSDCPATQYCDAGSCKDVQAGACGVVQNHAFVPYGYECGSEAGCPSCPSGELCLNHVCVQNDVTCPSTGMVGEQKTCSATENGNACPDCDFQVTAPDGSKSSGKTDENGNFGLPLTLEGNYQVALLRNGSVVKVISVQSLPQATPGGEEGKPTAAGGDVMSLVWLLLLVLLVAGAVIYWRRRQKS
jgi:parallel beta-helix repeat protein